GERSYLVRSRLERGPKCSCPGYGCRHSLCTKAEAWRQHFVQTFHAPECYQMTRPAGELAEPITPRVGRVSLGRPAGRPAGRVLRSRSSRCRSGPFGSQPIPSALDTRERKTPPRPRESDDAARLGWICT